MRRHIHIVALFFVSIVSNMTAVAQQRFPPPDFTETNHLIPTTTTPPRAPSGCNTLDVVVLFTCLRNRGLVRPQTALAARDSSGSPSFRSPISASGGKAASAPSARRKHHPRIVRCQLRGALTVIAFFAAPLLVALFAGRAFCAGVCPHGALRDLLLVKPIKVPAWLEHALGVLPSSSSDSA